jgi:hypothetical protein
MQSDLLAAAEVFGRSLQEMVDTIELDARRIILRVLLDLLSDLMSENPKDTHRCAASWNVDTHPSDWVEPPGDYTGVDLAARAKGIVDGLPDSDVYVLFNNIEYLMALEDGHSTRAPSGFIANALNATADYLSRAARERGYTS